MVSESSSSTTAPSSSTDVNDNTIQKWITANFVEDETQLVVGLSPEIIDIPADDRVCGGLPSLQTLSSTTSPNGACPDVFTAGNDSCTCISGFAETDTSWTFYVQSRTNNTTYPATQKSTEPLAIDAIRPIYISSTLQTLHIEGVGDSPVELTFLAENRTVTIDLPIAKAADGAILNLTTLELVNIDMSNIVTTVSTFIPDTVINVTMRNCNIDKFGFEFLTELSETISYMDYSFNSLTAPYAGSTVTTSCGATFCGLVEYNISYNKLKSFPAAILNVSGLERLYIQGNAITDFNISAKVFAAIDNLIAFESDQPDSSATCIDGTWNTTHGIQFCVLNNEADTDETSSSDHTHSVLIYVAIAGGILVFVLLLVLIKQRYFSSANTKKVELNSPFDQTSEIGDTYLTLNISMMNDPIIATNRIDYKDVKLGKCINRGGFGLVFIGEYKGRQVAVKKIGAEYNDEVAQIQQFIREITLMATLTHPRIVEFIGVAWNSLRNLCAVTEFMERGDLREVLQNFSNREGYELTWEYHKINFALHIAEGLIYLHSLTPKVIHRDLKSNNVLLSSTYEAKLSDFGISRERRFVESHMTTGVGTAFWIAPEVLLGRDYDERADIYSFGVVLSEIDTNDYPYWNAKNPPEGKIQEGDILRMVAAGNLRPSFSKTCPTEILDLAESCLSGNPSARPTATEIVYELRACIHSLRSSFHSF